MATLEKIRNKSVLLFVIIIVALLAFILGDFLTSGRTYFGSPTTVAKAGGASVDYQDYSKRLNEMSEQLRNQGREYNNDALTQNVVQTLMAEALLKQEYEKLGIKVTNQELTQAMTGENPDPAAMQMIYTLSRQLNLPEMSGRAVYDAMVNPTKYGLPAQAGEELKSIWAQQEKNVEESRLSRKYMNLIDGLFTYNNLDAKAYYDDNATTYHIAYVSKDASSISDEDAGFTDADVKALWNSRKSEYRLDEPMREIDYIYVAIEPSQADRVQGQQVVENALQGLNTTEGLDAVSTNSHFVVQTTKAPLSQYNRQQQEFIKEVEVGQAQQIERMTDHYVLAKLLGITQGIDSISVGMVDVAETVSIDSVVDVINGGKAIADVINNVTIAGQDTVWMPLEGIQIDEKIKAALTEAPVGKAFVYRDTIQGTPMARIFKVNRRHAPVNYYEVATIEYTVDPSQETLTDLTSALRTFISNNSSAGEFAKNAEEAGYSILNDQVSPSSTAIGNAKDSRRFVKWVMDAKKGQVSPLLQDDKQSYLMAIAVMDAYDDYLPYTSAAVNAQLRSQARNSKKAQKMLADNAGKASDLKGYAELLGAEVREGDVVFTSPSLVGVGVNESALQGAVAAAEKGKLVGPIAGNRGVMVFEVQSVDNDNRPFTAEEYGQRFYQTYGLSRRPTPLPMLLGKNKVENKSLNFVQAVGE